VSEEAVRGARSLRRAKGLSRKVRDVGLPVYDSLIREPFRQGRLRLDAVGGVERQLAIVGLVGLFAALLSLLLDNLWRRGDLLSLGDTTGRFLFIPQVLLGLTLLGLFIGWLVFLWGAVRGSAWVRVAAAALFLFVNASIGRPTVLALSRSLAIRWGPEIVRAAYFAVPAVLVLYSLLNVRDRWGRRARPFVLVLLGGSLAAMFGGILWMGATAIQHHLLNDTTLTLNGDVESIQSLLFPMVLLAAVALVDFSYSVSEAASAPAWEWTTPVIKALLAGVLALKIWIQLVRHWTDVTTFVRQTPRALVTALVLTAFLAGMAWLARWLRRRRASEEEVEDVKERLMLSGILAEAFPSLVILALASVAQFAITQAGSQGAARFVGKIAEFTNKYSVWVRLIPWALMLLVGIALLVRRSGREVLREAGLGLVLIGGWNVPQYLLAALNYHTAYDERLIEIVLTLGIAAVVAADLGLEALRAARLRSAGGFLDQPGAIALTALVILTWLMFTRGDFVATIATTVLRPVPFISGTAILVFGIVYTLLVDSELASSSSRHFPANARVLMWIGYLLISVTILMWTQVTHGTDLASTVAHNGFSDIGIPFAAWLFIRRPWTPEEARRAALPSEVGIIEAAEIERQQEIEEAREAAPETGAPDGPGGPSGDDERPPSG